MRSLVKTGMVLVLVAAVVAIAVWVFYSQRQDDLEANKAEGIGAPLDSIAAPADSASVYSDSTSGSID